jgi:hypothetical protein
MPYILSQENPFSTSELSREKEWQGSKSIKVLSDDQQCQYGMNF